jgi:hypothetical protein
LTEFLGFTVTRRAKKPQKFVFRSALRLKLNAPIREDGDTVEWQELGGLPDKMRVEVDSGIEISAKTVRKLRKVTVWPENLAISTPQFASLLFTI